jgi:hypothetical protein
MEPESSLWKEINELRHPEFNPAKPAAKDADELEREKLNDSCFGRLAGSKKFEYTTLSVIVANAGWIGYDADFSATNGKPSDLYICGDFPPSECYQFIIAENLFAFYFTFEVVVRMFSYRRPKDMCWDAWFVFDSTLVTLMILETWIFPVIGASGSLSSLSVLRLLRLLRITRMAKLMRFFPELQIIVKGMVSAVRSVICTAILLIGILYVFAIIFTSEYHQGDMSDEDAMGEVRQLFGSMRKSMRHLFIMGTILDDITLCCNYIRSSGKQWNMMTFFILFVLLSSFTMLNMLIGILCEVVCATGEGERQKIANNSVRDAITELFHKMDKDSNGEITREEFLSMKSDKHVMKALQALEVKAKHFEMYADLMFKSQGKDGGEPTCDFEKTINMIMELRPGSTVSALDFASFQNAIKRNNDQLSKYIYNIEKMASVLTGKEIPLCPQDANIEPQPDPASKEIIVPYQPIDKAPDQEILKELQRRIASFSAPEDWPER